MTLKPKAGQGTGARGESGPARLPVLQNLRKYTHMDMYTSQGALNICQPTFSHWHNDTGINLGGKKHVIAKSKHSDFLKLLNV